ncbi:MAG: peptide transporter permease [candidate division NC10 bacterium]|nr:peptide transporter permease [candidate division NC10 bacterium]
MSERRRSRRRWRLIFRRKIAAAGGGVILISVIVALLAPLLASHSPLALAPGNRLKPPSSAHWLGTDDVGRDIYSRVIYGARISLVVGASVVALAGLTGLAMGLASGFYRSLDYPIMRVMDGLMAFPGIILAIALMASLGPSLLNVIIALSVVNTPRVARLVRGSVLVLRETQYVEAALALGQRGPSILLRHVLRCSSGGGSLVVSRGWVSTPYPVVGKHPKRRADLPSPGPLDDSRPRGGDHGDDPRPQSTGGRPSRPA